MFQIRPFKAGGAIANPDSSLSVAPRQLGFCNALIKMPRWLGAVVQRKRTSMHGRADSAKGVPHRIKPMHLLMRNSNCTIGAVGQGIELILIPMPSASTDFPTGQAAGREPHNRSPNPATPELTTQAERAGVRMDARQGQDTRRARGLIHDSPARRATPIVISSANEFDTKGRAASRCLTQATCVYQRDHL